ncbi:hypothetical protein [Paracoccus sp. Ld10]|uniref:hypothetical protein n=1 Tax=Paracoccus sp. Ld10 TaxID=649158 RepID=UPI0038659F8A
MMQPHRPLKARLGALSVIACLIATQAGAQTGGGNGPTARDIWRHLPALPGQIVEPAPEALSAAPPAPRPARPAAAEPAPQTLASAAPVAAVPVARPQNPPAANPATSSRTLGQARVVIHYSERDNPERVEQVARLLRAVGTGEVETRPVPYIIDRQSIRYFFAADRDVSGIIGDAIGGGGRATVSDFTFFQPSPRGGTVEIWLP